jgi:hypothetical protein
MSYYPQKYGPCMCGATDCRSCGPAQGYRLDVDEDEDDFDPPTVEDIDRASDAAADKWDRDRERNQP